MNGFVLLLILVGLWWLFSKKKPTQSQAPRTSPTSPTGPTRPASPPKPNTFRPTAASGRSRIKFGQPSSPTQVATPVDIKKRIEGLHDAFTGAPLDPSLGLFQCGTCTVFYHRESYQVLREINNSLCISCHSSHIRELVAGEPVGAGVDHTPSVVTLDNYQDFVGSVVTFEGMVHSIKESRRGQDFAVMFENKSWTRGFKLVFFRDGAKRVGGKRYLNTLDGKNIQVRGLIVHHPRYGYEIVVSEKSMILSVK